MTDKEKKVLLDRACNEVGQAVRPLIDGRVIVAVSAVLMVRISDDEVRFAHVEAAGDWNYEQPLAIACKIAHCQAVALRISETLDAPIPARN